MRRSTPPTPPNTGCADRFGPQISKPAPRWPPGWTAAPRGSTTTLRLLRMCRSAAPSSPASAATAARPASTDTPSFRPDTSTSPSTVSAHAEYDYRGAAVARDLTGDVAVITGGGSPVGIGAATGRLLAQHGCRVVLSDVNPVTLATTVASQRAAGLDVTGIVADVSELTSMQALADQVFTEYGHVDIAFLNAGIGYAGSYFEDDIDGWHQVYGVNFFGVLHGIKAFVPRMVAQGTPGDVLGTTSGSGAVGVMYQTPAYSSSKAAVLTLMEGLYATLRDQNSVIRAHAVFPPLTKTNLGGDPSVMTMVQQSLELAGVAAVLAAPEEGAVS